MPSLKRPNEATRIDLPPRRALLAAETDVLVIGGGPAGLGAAGGAAQAGAGGGLAGREGVFGGKRTAARGIAPVAVPTPPPPQGKKSATPPLPPPYGAGGA